MIRFRRADDPHILAVSMTGVKTGDRLLQLGCGHGDRLGAIAAKVGLSGRAVAVVADEASATRAQKGAAKAGVLLDISIAPPGPLPLDTDAFDIAVIDDTDRSLANLAADGRTTPLGELFRTLRPGGRLIIIGAVPKTGLGGLFAGQPKGPGALRTPSDLQAAGFKMVRVLAERDGLSFLEGVKPR